MSGTLQDLLAKHQKGNRPALSLGPYLSIATFSEKGLSFNRILTQSRDMTQAALSNFELGFEAISLPFDLNVEAEILGLEVRYYDGYDGIPVYPTIIGKKVAHPRDIVLPAHVEDRGRMPEILQTLKNLNREKQGRGAVGVYLPGPFLLAGQVMDIDELFVMTIKKQDEVAEILERLTQVIIALREIYIQAGVDFITVEEGGATSISPKLFRKLLLPHLLNIFREKAVPHMLSLTGNAGPFIPLMLECSPDGLGVDQESDIKVVRSAVPQDIPLFAVCGDYDLLAKASVEEIEQTVRNALDLGVTSVMPPSDMYPPADPANIKAFIEAVKNY